MYIIVCKTTTFHLRFQFGSDVFNHLFDGSAVLQKFTIANGEVQYMCKFVKTKVFFVTCREGQEIFYLKNYAISSGISKEENSAVLDSAKPKSKAAFSGTGL